MKLLIEINIENNKTWAELAGGKIKVVINHFINKLNKALEKHTGSTMTTKWYGENDSDCSKCVFNKNNENDHIERLKNIEIAKEEKRLFYNNLEESQKEQQGTKHLMDCCHTSFSLAIMADGIHHNNCQYYKPHNKFLDEITYQEMQELQKQLDS